MTIRVFSPVVPGMQLGDSAEYEGSLIDLLRGQENGRTIEEARADFQIILNGDIVPSSKYASTYIAADDDLKIMIAAKGGAFKAIGSLLGGIFKVVFGIFGMNQNSDAGSTYSGGQGTNIEASALRANTPRQGATVPSAYGFVKRYPDMISEYRRYFSNEREQMLEVLLHLTIGEADGITPYLGETLLSDIPGCEYWIHQPGENLSGHTPAELWHSSVAVGGTSGGTAGISLSALAENQYFVLAPAYDLEGGHITPIDGYFPNSWGTNTVFSMVVGMEYWQTTEKVNLSQDITKFTGSFKHIMPLSPGKLVYYRRGTINSDDVGTELSVRDFEVDSNGEGWVRFDIQIQQPTPGSVPFFTNSTGQDRVAFSQGLFNGKSLFVINNRDGQTLNIEPEPWIDGWQGWAKQEASNIFIQYVRGAVYGEYTPAFVVSPSGQLNSLVEVDIFFPQGLRSVRDDGSPDDHSVTVEIEFSDALGIVPKKTIQRTYTDATPDQIGFTERFWYDAPARCRVRMRRIGAISSDPKIVDEVQWYGLRCRMPEKNQYPGWTTMSVRLKSGNQLGAQSENRINATFTRKLPRLNADGSLTGNEPTRDISSALLDVTRSAGQGVMDWHPDLIHLDSNYWKPRNEYFDFILDETTIKGALDMILQAGFSELTQQDGFLKPVRDIPRTTFDQGFSPQNMYGEVTVSSRHHRNDDNDGYEIEYVDQGTRETTTIKCLPPGSLGVRLRKKKIDGVIQEHIAWRIGMRAAMSDLYRRTGYSFRATASGLNAFYRDYVPVVTSLRNWGQSFKLVNVERNSDKAFLFLSERIVFNDVSPPYVAAIRNNQGQVLGPFPATVIDAGCIEISGVSGSLPTPSLNQDMPDVYFGSQGKAFHKALVERVKPDKGMYATVDAINYDERVYIYDDQFPPEK